MRYFFYSILASFFFVLNLHAMEPQSRGEKIIEAIISGDVQALKYLDVQEFQRSYPGLLATLAPKTELTKPITRNASLLDVKNHIINLVRSGVNPSSILFIVDNDGTLTISKTPSDDVQERGESVQMLRDLLQMGVHVVVSSAWWDFETTLDTLETLGIAGNLIADVNDIMEITNTAWPPVQGFVSGLVCSLKYQANNSNGFFRQKALTSIFIYGRKAIPHYQYVIFADDSDRNLKHFVTDIELLGLQADTVINLFLLGPSKNEPGWPMQ